MPNTYFTIPFEQTLTPAFQQALEAKTYRAWFACWTRTPPDDMVNGPPLFVVGATQGELPRSATLLGEGVKDRPEQEPPPLPPSPTSVSLAEYQQFMQRWLKQGQGSERYRYFALSYSQMERQPSYLAWYAAWCDRPPVVAEGMPKPLVIGFSSGTLPEGADVLASNAKGGGKDPPAPPPAAPPGTSLARHISCLEQNLEDLASGRGAD